MGSESENHGVPRLILIVGPIASGKSTVARGLATRLREAGHNVAVLDLDDVVGTIGGFVDLTPKRFHQAHVVHRQLVGAWLGQGFDVITHGAFFEPGEIAPVLEAMTVGTRLRRVHLLATYEVALERVAADPDRELSRQPEVLRLAYDHAEALLPTLPPSDWTFDTTTTRSTQIVEHLAAVLLNG